LFNKIWDNIIEKSNRSKNLSLIAEAMISDGGTATKKLDFVYIDLKDKPLEMGTSFEIVFGSGLDKELPTKCPLFKNLKYNLSGDNDAITPEDN